MARLRPLAEDHWDRGDRRRRGRGGVPTLSSGAWRDGSWDHRAAPMSRPQARVGILVQRGTRKLTGVSCPERWRHVRGTRPVGETGGDAQREDWDAALNRLLEGVNLDDLQIPLATDSTRSRLTFSSVHDRVADQLREKIRSERLRRDAIAKDRKSTRLNSSHTDISRMPSSA